MKLTDLDPKWFAEAGRHGQGLTFRCPHCMERLGVAFANPLDGGAPFRDPPACIPDALKAVYDSGAEQRGTVVTPPGHLWQRTGETFETLTLAPSLDFSRSGCWHGFVQNGEIR